MIVSKIVPLMVVSFYVVYLVWATKTRRMVPLVLEMMDPMMFELSYILILTFDIIVRLAYSIKVIQNVESVTISLLSNLPLLHHRLIVFFTKNFCFWGKSDVDFSILHIVYTFDTSDKNYAQNLEEEIDSWSVFSSSPTSWCATFLSSSSFVVPLSGDATNLLWFWDLHVSEEPPHH